MAVYKQRRCNEFFEFDIFILVMLNKFEKRNSRNYPMVSVVIVTYNQEQWIKQTIESILSQNTCFSYEIIIGEDFGSDNTRRICQFYADKFNNVTLLSQDRNLGLVGNFVRCVKACSGRYIMCCAGDDYWHNHKKIQLQVDFMEHHPECVLCHTDIDLLNVKSGRLLKNYKKSRNIVPPEGMIQKQILAGKEMISAVTMCVRHDIIKKYVPLDKFIELNFPREDWPMLIILSAYGVIRYIPESTATYRTGQVSVTNMIDYDKIIKRWQDDKRMTEFLYSIFPNFGPFTDGQYFDNFVYHSLLMAAYENNDYTSAHKYAGKDPRKGWASKMASNRVTFIIYRIYRNLFRSHFM